MKELLAVISLLVSGAVAEPPAPYPPSGWRPSGPSFELPEQGQAQQQPAQYLPPLDPRNPATTPNVEYGTPEEDVSVQGLPPQGEEVQSFQRSPINGQQNVGPAFNSDIRNLDKNLQQIQYQQQQQSYREFQRQRQLDAQFNSKRLPRPEQPTVFVSRTTPTTTEATTPETTTISSTTELNLNEGETLEAPKKKEKVTVEISAQKIQQYPGELFLSSLAQLQLQPQFIPLQFGQLKAPAQLYLQPAQEQKQAGFDAQTHFAALPSILAQQKLQQQNVEQGFRNPALLITEQPQAVPQLQPITAYQQPQFQTEQVAVQPQVLYGQPAAPVTQYQPVNYQPQLEAQEQPQPQFQLQPLPQYAAQPVSQSNLQPAQFQPQPAQFQPQPAQFQPQVAHIQPQPAQYQPQPAQFQPQPAQLQPQPAQFQPQPALFQPQPAQFQPQLAQFQPQPAQFQPQPAQFQPGQFQIQGAQFQPQPAQFQPQPDNQDAENIDQSSYQPQIYQAPFLAPQPQQPGYIQAQLINYPGQDLSQFQGQFQQGQFAQQNQFQPQSQGPDALQSGLDVNQQGNDLEEPQDQEQEGQDEGSTVTAVATAFGTRTQPRVFTQYGAPYPVPKVQAAPVTTESPAEEVTDDGPVVAQAVAIADGTRKKSAKLRRSRIRPIFTLDKSGHLVLAQAQ